jgi:hypothetical protein
MLGNISYHQYITTARLQINFTNRVKDMLKFAAQVSPPFPLIHSAGDSAAYPGFFFGSRIRIFSIQDPNLLHPGSRIRIKEIKYSYPKKWFLSTQKYDPGCLSRIRILDPDRDFLPIPDSGSKGQKKAPDPGSGSATLVGDPDVVETETFCLLYRSVPEPVSLFDVMSAVQLRSLFLNFPYYSL